MSRIRANTITNQNANGAPNFPDGITVSGVVTATTTSSTLNTIVVGSAVTANSQGIDVTGIVTATSFKGAATNLTSIPAANLTGALPAISGANLTGIAADKVFEGNTEVETIDTGSDGHIKFTTEGTARSRIDVNGHFTPETNNTYDLGTSSLRWRVVYTNDLELSNKGSQNSVDGTWGDWTLQEGENDIFMINNRSGKKFKINLTEVS